MFWLTRGAALRRKLGKRSDRSALLQFASTRLDRHFRFLGNVLPFSMALVWQPLEQDYCWVFSNALRLRKSTPDRSFRAWRKSLTGSSQCRMLNSNTASTVTPKPCSTTSRCVPTIRNPGPRSDVRATIAGSMSKVWTLKREHGGGPSVQGPGSDYFRFRPSRQAMTSSSPRTASSTGITGCTSNTNAGSIEQNL